MSSLQLARARIAGDRRVYLFSIRLAEVILFAASGLGAFLLRFELSIPPHVLPALWFATAVWLIVKPIAYYSFGLWSGGWRFVSVQDVQRFAAANATASFVSAALIHFFGPPHMGRSIYLIDMLLCFLLTVGARLGVRIAIELWRARARGGCERAFIYGAGDAGRMVLRESRSNGQIGLHFCGFIDDNPLKHGLRINGVKVVGSGSALPELAAKHSVTQVLIAIPAASGAEMAKILGYCTDAKLRFKTVPGIAEILGDEGLVNQFREVAVEDLLGRTPVRLEVDPIRDRIAGAIVLVTGAAGSIGSELCRQIARFDPEAIVAFEVAETALFELEQGMRGQFPSVRLEPVIGNIKDMDRLREVLREYRPSVVFHAAAYKHVPIMEAHLFEAVENNVVGTYNAAVAAAEFGAQDFVLISSDKAVRPTSIMGLTKRIAEVMIASLPPTSTKYVSVRFGNVLGSNGSVVPIFKNQIMAGGPVTVTHPEMRRYFMTIPEAAQLVLQAFAMGNGGELFVLDMGEPVKVVDLARNMILLSGLKPDVDVRIEFTGIRPGEKLYEELSTNEEETIPTFHEKIRIFSRSRTTLPDVAAFIASIRAMCRERSGELLIVMKAVVPEYNPSTRAMETLLHLRSDVRVGTHDGRPVLVRTATSAPLNLAS